MIYRLRIRLTSQMLGARSSQNGMRTFDRHPSKGSDWMDFSAKLWRWAVQEAVEGLHLKQVQPDCIQPPQGYLAPHTTPFARQFKRGENKERDVFEAIRAGTVLTLRFAVTAPPPGALAHLRKPDAEELEQIFKYIGEFLGISPWGNKFGFGRYVIEDLSDDLDPTVAEGDVGYGPDPEMSQISPEQEDSVFGVS